MKLCRSSPGHPHTDDAYEVMNRVVQNYIRGYCEYKQGDWDTFFPAAEFAYSSAVSEDLGMTPVEVDLGWRPRGPLEL